MGGLVVRACLSEEVTFELRKEKEATYETGGREYSKGLGQNAHGGF